MALPAVVAFSIGALKSVKIAAAIGRLWGGAKVAGSFLLKGGWTLAKWLFKNRLAWLGLGAFLVTALVSVVQNGAGYIWNFNWNTTEQQLQSQIQSSRLALAAAFGGFLGNVAGFVTCGAVANAPIFVFNPAWGLVIAKELGQEALDEGLGHLSNAFSVAGNLAAQEAFLRIYSSNRQFFNGFANATGNTLSFLQSFLGGRLSWEEYRRRRGSNQLVSFADYWEENLETLDPVSQAFWEEFFEEASDACWESFYVVAGGLEALAAQERLRRTEPLGPYHTVVITPDREISGERIILHGPEEILKPQIVQTLAYYNLNHNRDVGQIVGMPAADWVTATPQSLRMQIVMFSEPEPPYGNRGGKRLQKAEITIPDVNPAKIDWERIKRAVGGKFGYMYGRYRATANLTNGRQMAVYAATEAEAEDIIKACIDLSRAEIETLSITEEKNEGARRKYDRLKKDAVRVYPAYLFLVNRKDFLDQEKGRAGTSGAYSDREMRLELWPDQEPDNFKRVVSEILMWGTTRGNPSP